jgi:hypothetical protein
MSQGSIFDAEAIIQWLNITKTVPIIYLSIILLPITLLGAIFFGRDQKVGQMMYLVNIIGSFLYVVIVSGSMKLIIDVMYFSHIYPFFVLNLIGIPLYIVRKWNVNTVKLLVMIPLAYFLFFVLVVDFSVTIPKGYTRLMYKNTITYKVYIYVNENIPSGSKIAHDQFVAIPSSKGLTGCHYWQGCGTDYIEEFKPDYVMFSKDWKFNGKTTPETMRLEKYISDHHFILIDAINTTNTITNIDATSNENPIITISVWKKPDP